MADITAHFFVASWSESHGKGMIMKCLSLCLLHTCAQTARAISDCKYCEFFCLTVLYTVLIKVSNLQMQWSSVVCEGGAFQEDECFHILNESCLLPAKPMLLFLLPS